MSRLSSIAIQFYNLSKIDARKQQEVSRCLILVITFVVSLSERVKNSYRARLIMFRIIDLAAYGRVLTFDPLYLLGLLGCPLTAPGPRLVIA